MHAFQGMQWCTQMLQRTWLKDTRISNTRTMFDLDGISGDQKEAIACVAARSSRAKREVGRFRVPPLRCSARGLLAHTPIGCLELKTAQHLKHVLSEHSALYF